VRQYCREPSDPTRQDTGAAAALAADVVAGEEDDYEEVRVEAGEICLHRSANKQEVEEGGAAPITLGVPFALKVALTNTGFVSTLYLAGKEW
jgi:hypothetical protein